MATTKPIKTMREHILEQIAREERRGPRTTITRGMSSSERIRAKNAKIAKDQEKAARLAEQEKRAKKAVVEKPVKVKKVRKARMYRGNAPKSEGWCLEGYIERDGVMWRVYYRRIEQWFNVKIAAAGFAPDKANYWMSFVDGTMRFTSCGEAILKHEFDLFNSMITKLKMKYPQFKPSEQYLTEGISRKV
jgi:hypothetical protein